MVNTAVGSMSAEAGVLKDLFRQIEDGSMTLDALKGFVAHRQIRRFRLGDTKDGMLKNLRVKWEERWKTDFSGLFVPEHREGFDRLLVIPQGMRPNRAFARLKEKPMPIRRYTEKLDTIWSGRLANADYAVWVRDCQEADERLKEKSANDALAALINSITLEERLVLEEDWFNEHQTHLDVENLTLCGCSRAPDGGVPGVSWRDGGVGVDYCSDGDASLRWRVREVVS